MIENKTQTSEVNLRIKEAAHIVDSPPPITWEWLAGFFQAEGHVGTFSQLTNGSRMLPYPQVIITQKEPEILNKIALFLKEQDPNITTCVYFGKQSGANDIRLRGYKNVKCFYNNILSLPSWHKRSYSFSCVYLL